MKKSPRQAGFRKNRSCTDQVMALTCFIESGFQKKMKTGAVFFDLSAAYDTVWRHGLLLKLIETVPCIKICNLIDDMLSNRFFQVHLNGQTSRWRRLNNGLPQGSVLSPLLFALYVADLPHTQSMIFQYAYDMAIAFQSSDADTCENVLEPDLAILADYYRKWRLVPNPSKSESSLFHPCNRDAGRELSVNFDGLPVKAVINPKYLGVTLDRTLSFKTHLEKLGKKLNSRVNIVRKLAGSSWGADTSTLRTSTLLNCRVLCTCLGYQQSYFKSICPTK